VLRRPALRTFHRAIASSTGPGTAPFSVAVADVNLDGVPDLITADSLSDGVAILLGIGNGHFEPAIEMKLTRPVDATYLATSPFGVAAGDFNGDGKPDLATANGGSYDVAVKWNTGR
jgi:hypothetical protein